MHDAAEIRLPDEIERLTAGLPYTQDSIGLSGALVRMYDTMVLKVQPSSQRTRNEAAMLRWLSGKLPAPQLLSYAETDGMSCLLMMRIRGKMACDDFFLDRPALLIDRLAEALQLLWRTDTSGCPVLRGQAAELQEARRRVENGLVDLDDTEPGTFGPGGFRDPEALLVWLENNRPSFEPVLSHGDLCLPNLFLTQTGIGGFIDLGDAGVGDRWRDIALCHRSLRHNLCGQYATRAREDVADRLFGALGLRPDQEKLRWYLLLDELF